MATIVPKGREAWPEDYPPYRVEYLDRSGSVEASSGSLLRKVYFEGSAEASAFADEHRSWGGAECTVESREMPVTHEVHKLALDSNYIFSIKRFGDLPSALVEYNLYKTRARKHGGRVQLRAVGTLEPLAETSHAVD